MIYKQRLSITSLDRMQSQSRWPDLPHSSLPLTFDDDELMRAQTDNTDPRTVRICLEFLHNHGTTKGQLTILENSAAMIPIMIASQEKERARHE